MKITAAEYTRKWKLANPEKAAAQNRKDSRKRRKNYPKEINAANRKWRRRVRLEVLAAYGGACACCGITEEAFLTIDHVKKHSGAKHRAQTKWAHNIYIWLRAHGFPKKNFQILCANCQMGKERPDGCPHRKKTKHGRINQETRRNHQAR